MSSKKKRSRHTRLIAGFRFGLVVGLDCWEEEDVAAEALGDRGELVLKGLGG